MKHWTPLILAVVGVGVCLVGVGGFLWAVLTNNLDWAPNQSAREYYVEVGNAFGDGFVMGFFLCFFLVLAAIAVGTLLGFIKDHRRAHATETVSERRFQVINGRRS